MDILIQNIKQEDLKAFQELAERLEGSLEVLVAHTPCDHLEVFANTPTDGATPVPQEGAKLESSGHHRQPSRMCNSHYDPLNTHQRDHRTHNEHGHEHGRTHRHKKGQGHDGTSEPFL
ncbi:hypothetical protein [Helicobacter salomonis]|uniref:hypothetical protein n=1 Tax=Helicobacter salomonis TaxID=56878 RepID=UPI000CF05678|nr:hypothetical protein [Helicobacter salomonis]